MNYINIILSFILLLFVILFFGIAGEVGFNINFKSQSIINIKCNCKYSGPYIGKAIEKENGREISNCFFVCWWELKRKAPSGEIFYDIVKIYKTQTDNGGNFLIPKFPGKKDKYTCCPKGIIYDDENLYYINFSGKLKCFKRKDICILYLKKMQKKESQELLKIIPAEIKKVLNIN